MTKFPLGFNINIKTLDEQFGTVTQPPEERPDDILMVTGQDMTTEEAKAFSLSGVDTSFQAAFLRGYAKGQTALELAGQIQDEGVKRSDLQSNGAFVAEQALTLDDYEYSAVEARMTSNIQVAQEIIQKRMQQIGEEKTLFGRGLDVADRFLRMVSPIGVYEDLTAEQESNGRLILDKATTLSPAEFKVWFEGFADEVGKEGIFRSNTLSAFTELSGEVASAGYDPMKEFNQLFAAIDVATGFTAGAAIKGVSKAALKATTPVGRVTAIKGPVEGAKAAEAILAKGPDPEALNNVGPTALSLAPQPVSTPQALFAQKFAENRIAQEMDGMFQKGAFGRVATKESVASAAKEIAETRIKNVANPVFDFRTIDEGLGNYIASVRFGRPSDGVPFKPLESGQPPESLKRFLEDVKTRAPDAEIVPVNPGDLRQGYVIEVKERVNTSGLQEAIDEARDDLSFGWVRSTVGKVLDNPLLGSSALRDVRRLETLNAMGESARAAVKQYIAKPYLKAMEALPSKDRYTLNRVYGELRDGADSELRVRYTDEEFRAKWKAFHPKGEEPSGKALEAYKALATFEEADYLLKATNILQRYLEKGYKNSVQVYDNYFAPAKQVRKSDVPSEARLVDGETGSLIRVADLEGEEFPVWKLDRPTKGGHEYVVAPKSVRMIDPTDVVGYNPGGTRTNPHLNYFVVIGGKRLKALMGAFSEKQAKKGKAQLATLQRAINDGTITDDLVQANNDWNPGILSVEDLRKFSEDEGWDLSEGVLGVKARDDDIIDAEVDGEGLFVGLRADDYIQNDMRRNDRVLLDFGGGRAYNDDPVNSVLAQFGKSVFAYSNRAYARNAMVGWVKRVQKAGRGWLPANVPENNYEELFRGAKITGTDSFSRRMKELHGITSRKLNMRDDFSRTMESWGLTAAEFVFDKTGLKIPSLATDPTDILLKIGFQAAFGFFNPSQLLLQGFHAISIMRISPTHGPKGAALVQALRGTLHAYEKGAGQEAINRFAKAAGVTPAEAKEWVEYIRTSGRGVVEGDMQEDGSALGWGISGWKGEQLGYKQRTAIANTVKSALSKTFDTGLVFFKSGERLTRYTSMNTAILEFRAANPGVSILSDQARKWIAQRDQTLTFNMNSSSRSLAQSGAMKVPTQWLSYSLRASEAVFVGRGLSAAERRRLATVLIPFYGLSGFGAGVTADYLAEKFDLEPGGSAYTALKSGVMDGLFAEANIPVKLGERLAPVGAFLDVYKNLTEGQFLTVVGGPSGEITQGLFNATANALTSLFTGQTYTLTEDAIQVLRTPSGIDNVFKAVGIFNNGIYRSKKGIAVPFEMTTSEGIAALMGFTPDRVVEFYNRKTDLFNDTKALADFRKDVNRDAEFIFSLLKGDAKDIERAIGLARELEIRISFSGFSQTQMASLRKSAQTMSESDWVRIQENLIAQDNLYGLRAANEIFEGNK